LTSLQANRHDFWHDRALARSRTPRPVAQWSTEFVDAPANATNAGELVYDIYLVPPGTRARAESDILAGHRQPIPGSPMTLVAARTLTNPTGQLRGDSFIALNGRSAAASSTAVGTSARTIRRILTFGSTEPLPTRVAEPVPPTPQAVALKKATRTAARRRQRHARTLRDKQKRLEQLQLDSQLVAEAAKIEQSSWTLVTRKKRAAKAKPAVAGSKDKDAPPKAPGSYRKVKQLTKLVDELNTAVENDHNDQLPDILNKLSEARERLRPKVSPPSAPT